jgi:hypothetical protein
MDAGGKDKGDEEAEVASGRAATATMAPTAPTTAPSSLLLKCHAQSAWVSMDGCWEKEAGSTRARDARKRRVGDGCSAMMDGASKGGKTLPPSALLLLSPPPVRLSKANDNQRSSNGRRLQRAVSIGGAVWRAGQEREASRANANLALFDEGEGERHPPR